MSRLIVLAAALAVAGAARAGETEPHFGPAEAWVKPAAPPLTVVQTPEGAVPAKLLLVDIENYFGPNGDERYLEYAGKVLTPDGLSALGGFSAEWNPDIESVTINKLAIIRNGTVIDRLPIDKFMTLRRETNLEKAMLDGRLTAAVQVTDLQVGDVVDFAYTVTRKDPILQGHSEGEQHLVHGFAPSVLQFRDVWPSLKPVRWHAAGGLLGAKSQAEADTTAVGIRLDNLATVAPPDDAPARFKDLGRLEFSSFTDWSEVSSLLYPLFETASTLSPTSPLKAEAEKIKAASDDPEVRAGLALRLVQDQVRYLFVGLDNGGYNPAAADQTWSRRFGDCKGKTALLLALLHELGIQAEAVMVNTTTGDSLSDRLPKIEVFDHVLVRAYIDGKSFWLDGTGAADRDIRNLSQPPYGWGLPVRASGAKLERMDGEPMVLPMGETVMSIDSSQGLDQPPVVKVESILHGAVGVLFSRRVGAMAHDDAEKTFMAAWGKGYGWVDVKSVDWAFDADKGEFRFWMTGTGKPGSWPIDNQTGGQVFEIDGSAFAQAKPLARPAGPDADLPFALPFPGYERSVTVLKLPNGGAGYALVGENLDETLNGMNYRRQTRFEHGMVVMSRSTRAMKSEITAAQAKLDNLRVAGFRPGSAWVRAPVAGKESADIQSLVQHGYDLLNQDQPDQAMAAFDKALAAEPNLLPAVVGRADARAEKGDFDGALSEYDRASGMSNIPQISAGRGGILFAAGRFDQAVQVYSEALARGPNAGLYRARAEARAAQGQLDLALQDAEAALKLAPADPASFSLRGALRLAHQLPREALADYDRAVQLDPDDQDNLIGRGLVYARLKQWDRALTEFDEAHRIDPASVRPLQARAEAEEAAARFPDAVHDLDAALDLTPGSTGLLNARCWARGKWGQQLDLALADCEAALKTSPNSAAILDSRALVRLRLGKLDDAIADYDAALKAQPKLAASLYGRGLAKLKKGDASGRADLDAARAISPDVAAEFAEFGLKL